MKCPRCGNEVNLGEAYCGQCGSPIAAPQTLQTEMVNTPPPPSGRLNSYPPQRAIGAQTSYGSPLNTEGTSLPPPSSPTPQLPQQPTASQGTGFYRDATEAMPVLPSNPNAGYQQPHPTTPPSGSYPPTPANYGFPGQPPPQQVQPLQTGNYAGQGYPQQPIPERQSYRSVPTPPQKQQNGTVIFIVSICLVIALLSLVGIGTLYIIKGRNTASNDTPGVTPTATLAPTATTIPTATATTEPTATTVPTPTPTVVPTATPVAGFAYCGSSCVTNGFSTQYPQSWSAIPLTGTSGVQFMNPDPTDQSATFKTPGATTSSPNELVANDLQQNFATKNGYTVVTPMSTASIGGETWFEEIITYQGATQKEHVEVYANVHQGKAYILELQASEDQFTTVTTQYFTTIMREFQFQ